MSVKRLERKIKQKEITFFTRNLATLLSAGFSIIQALNLNHETQKNSSLKMLISCIKFDIENGCKLSFSLKKTPRLFNSIYIGLIEIAESSGRLDLCLMRLATDREKGEGLKKKILKALYYPIVILFTAMIVTAVMLIKVLPTFKEIYDSLNQTLPLATQGVLKFASLLETYGLGVLFVFVLFGSLFIFFYRKSASLRREIETLFFKLPLLGPLLIKMVLANLGYRLSVLLEAGIPLTSALDTVTSHLASPNFQFGLNRIKIEVAQGKSLTQSMTDTHLFPALALQFIAIGEECGKLDAMLAHMASLYESELESTIDSLTTLIEPALMIVLGGLVGGLLVAMYLPLFNMGALY